MGKLDVENILDENQHAELVALTNRWAATPPGERSWVIELIRGKLWEFLGARSWDDKKEAIDEFVENLKSTAAPVIQVPVLSISENHKRGVGSRIERLAMKTDGGLSRAAFHIAFVDSLPEIKEIVNILDPSHSWVQKEPEPSADHGWVCYNGGPGTMFWNPFRINLEHELSEDIRPATPLEKSLFKMYGKPTTTGGFEIEHPSMHEVEPDWPVPATEEMEEWVTIYGLEWLPFSRWRDFEREHGWTGDFVERVASRKFGTFGEIVAVQQEKGQIFFYVYRDLDPMQVGIDDQTEIFYKAPPILGSN